MATTPPNTCLICGAELPEACDSGRGECAACRTRRDAAALTVPMPGTERFSSGNGHASANPAVPDDVAPTQVDLKADAGPEMAPTQPVPAAGPTSGKASRRRPGRLGRFLITGILGRGTFGTVYRAHDPLLDRDVAIKIPRFEADDRDSLERFHREARAAARLRHPNIVALYETGESEEGPFLVAELVDGVALSQYLQQAEHRVELRTAAEWVRQIAEALHYAHGEDVIHRDVKPANIMLSRAGRPQVMDFGLAKRVSESDSNVTLEGQIVGTPNYMAPEQARGDAARVGAHSDQYSVGAVLYELICGRTPYLGESWRVIAQVADPKELPPTPRSLRPEIPRDLEACCLKAMEKDPARRYPNLGAMADDLAHWLKGLPLAARPIGPIEQLHRWCLLNKPLAALGTVLVALILGAAIAGHWLAYRFRSLAEAAQKASVQAQLAVVDAYTESGLAADRFGQPGEAVLWFANSVAAAGNHPLREAHNRIRLQAWLPRLPIPVRAFRVPEEWNRQFVYHPDGRTLLALSFSGELSLLDLVSERRLPPPLEGRIVAAAWSPDGRALVLARDEPSPEILAFEWPRNRLLYRFRHPDPVECLKFSGDGRWLLVAGERTAQIRDFARNEPRGEAIEPGGAVRSAAISHEGRYFALLCRPPETEAPRQVYTYTVPPDGGPITPALTPQSSGGEIEPLFLGDGRLIVADNQGTLRCWELGGGSLAWECPLLKALTIAVSADGRWIAHNEHSKVVVREARTGAEVARIACRNQAVSLSFHPRGDRLLVGCLDHTARVFEVPSGAPAGEPIPQNKAVHRVVWSPDGTHLATITWGGPVVRVWRHQEGRPGEYKAAPSAYAPFVRISREGDHWLPVGTDTRRERIEAEVLDLATGQPVGPKLPAPGRISDCDFVPGTGLVVLAGGGDPARPEPDVRKANLETPGFVRFLEAATGRPAMPDLTTSTQPVAVRSSPDGRSVVVLCQDSQVLILDPSTGRPRFEATALAGRPALHGFVIRDRIRFSPKGDLFALWGCRRYVELRRTADGAVLATLRQETDLVHNVVFSPDGRLLAVCVGDGGAVQLWRTDRGEPAGPPLKHSGWVFDAQFSRDGRRLLTASSDRHARVWDVASGQVIASTRELQDEAFGVCFLPGDELFLVADRAHTVTAWDAVLGKMMAPSRPMPEMVYQLARSDHAPQVLASGRVRPIRGIDWTRWLPAPDRSLSRQDVRLLGEILSSQYVHQGGAATWLSASDWLRRWEDFRARHPDYPLFAFPAASRSAAPPLAAAR